MNQSTPSEFEKFLARDDVQEYKLELEFINYLLTVAFASMGLQEHNFRKEVGNVTKLFASDLVKNNRLRLFCLRVQDRQASGFDKDILIIGDGGVKIDGTEKTQDNPHLMLFRDEMKRIEKLIQNRIWKREIWVSPPQGSRLHPLLCGELKFY
ncbi:MAG: hypothetical protein V4642_00060 [Bacteroidota bacterium]